MLGTLDLTSPPPPPQTRAAVLEVRALTTRFATPDGEVLAADGVGFTIGPGESAGRRRARAARARPRSSSRSWACWPRTAAARARSATSGTEILNLPAAELNEIRGDEDGDDLPGPDDLAQPVPDRSRGR